MGGWKGLAIVGWWGTCTCTVGGNTKAQSGKSVWKLVPCVWLYLE